MTPLAIVRLAWREARGSGTRLFFFIACLGLGVAAITAVASLVGAVRSGLHAASRDLLGADVSIQARRPIGEGLDAFFAFDPERERAQTKELATMAKAGERSRLVELKAVSANFPFYGTIALEPFGRLADALTEDACVVAPDLLRELGLAIGDELALGGQPFTVAAVVTDEPGRLDIALTLGPRVFVSLAGLERAGLEQFGSRVRYRELYRLPSAPDEDALERVEDRIDAEFPGAEYLRFETHRETQPTVRRALSRVERYLGLVALLSLVLGGVGVAQIVRAWLASRTKAVAILRVLGFRPREVLWTYLGHIALLALVGSTLGALLGSLSPLLVERFAPELLPQDFELEASVFPILRSVALGIGIAWIFSLPPLTALWRVPPARVLRHDAEPLPAPALVRWSAQAAVALGLFAAAWAQSDELDLAAGFTLALALLAGLLALGARVLTALARRFPRERFDPYLRHGVAALARPGVGVQGAIVALGFGVLVVMVMVLVEGRLADRLRHALPADAPSVFFLDVQPDQGAVVRAQLERAGASFIREVPVLTARLSEIDGRSVHDRSEQPGSGRRRGGWVLTREQRLTWMRELPPDNRIVAGELWSDPERFEVSVEQGYAEDLGVGVGSRLGFDVQGVPVELAVTSVRTVEWDSFGVNFFLVAEPGALDAAPHSLLVAARVDAAVEPELQTALAGVAPNVTPIRVREILEKVLHVLSRLAVAVRVLGLFTIGTGLAILAGVASSAATHRGREVALLKTLGLTRWGVVRLLGTEFALIGLVAGAIGGAGAFGLAWLFLEQVVELGAELRWELWPFAAALTALASAVCGLAANLRALNVRPLESLRG